MAKINWFSIFKETFKSSKNIPKTILTWLKFIIFMAFTFFVIGIVVILHTFTITVINLFGLIAKSGTYSYKEKYKDIIDELLS